MVLQEANQPDKLVFHLLEKAAQLLTEGGGVRSNYIDGGLISDKP